MPARIHYIAYPTLALAMLGLGLGLGWKLPPPRDATPNSRANSGDGSASAQTELAASSSIGSTSGQAPGQTGGGAITKERPLGLDARLIMADIVTRLESGGSSGNAIEARLNLLKECGEEGRMAMAEFLKQNADYSIYGNDEILSDYDSLRFQIVRALSNEQSPESEAAMRLLVATSPNLKEAMAGLEALDGWGLEIGDAAIGQLKKLTTQELLRISEAKDSQGARGLYSCGEFARKYARSDLLPEVEKVYAKLEERKETAGSYPNFFISMEAEQQEECLRRLGPESPLVLSLFNNPGALVLADFASAPMADAVVAATTSGRVSDAKLQPFLANEVWLNNTKPSPSETGLGWSSHGFTSFSTVKERDTYLAKLAGIERILQRIENSDQISESIHAVAQLQLKAVQEHRQQAQSAVVPE